MQKRNKLFRLNSMVKEMKVGGKIMKGKCELIDKCSYFNIYSKNSKSQEAWTRLFCMDKKKSEKCERKKIRNQTGEPPLDNMTPTGEMLPLE